MEIVAPFSGIIVELPYFTSGTKADVGSTMVKLMDYSSLFMELKSCCKKY